MHLFQKGLNYSTLKYSSVLFPNSFMILQLYLYYIFLLYSTYGVFFYPFVCLLSIFSSCILVHDNKTIWVYFSFLEFHLTLCYDFHFLLKFLVFYFFECFRQVILIPCSETLLSKCPGDLLLLFPLILGDLFYLLVWLIIFGWMLDIIYEEL